MTNIAFIQTTIVGVTLMMSEAALGQVPINRGLYQIVSGTYSQAGGFTGGWSESLPSGAFAFVALSADRGTETSQLIFLGRNLRPSFSPLTNGVTSGDQLRFDYVTVFPSPTNVTTINYAVTTNADTIVVDGSADISYHPCQCVCADCVTGHQHTLVRAILTPVVAIRVVDRPELCWATTMNRSYRVYYTTGLTTNPWMSWEAPIAGTGTTVCVPIPVATNQQVFYRVAAIP
jgi:hypothetical protein